MLQEQDEGPFAYFWLTRKGTAISVNGSVTQHAKTNIGQHSEQRYNYNPNCAGFVLDIETSQQCSAIAKMHHCVVSLDSICRCDYDDKDGRREMSMFVSIRCV